MVNIESTRVNNKIIEDEFITINLKNESSQMYYEIMDNSLFVDLQLLNRNLIETYGIIIDCTIYYLMAINYF